MSIESMAIALHHSRSRGTAKVVLLGIANHDGDGGSWPSLATLSRYANVDVRNVQKAVRKLEALGEVETVLGEGGTRQKADHERPNLYRFLLRCPPECDRSTNHRMTPPTKTSPPPPDENVTSPPDENVTRTIHEPPAPQPLPAASGGKGLRSELVFGWEWQQEWEWLQEDRFVRILFREAIRDPDRSQRIAAEWAATCEKKQVDEPAGLLLKLCRAGASLRHTSAGDSHLPPFS